jgi:DNA repair exonuclease SbcCD ATPase subunit
MRRAALVAACCVAVLAASCGGDDSSADAWADDFCTAVEDWRERVQDAAGQLAEPATLSEERLGDSIRQAVAASDDLLADLGELGPPDVESRDEIEQELDHLESVLRERATNARAGIDQPAGTLSEALARLAALTRELSAAAASIEATVAKLRQLDPAGELRDALGSSESCASLHG